MQPRHLRLPVALAVALAVVGCGLADPYGSEHPTRTTPLTSPSSAATTPTVTSADPAPERGGTIPSAAQPAQNKVAANAGSPTPQAALERYASLDINWTASTVAGVQQELAAISAGQARAQALQAAASYGRDSTLQASQVANTGTIVAIAPGKGPVSGSWVIVTRETTTGQGDYTGLPPTDHVTDAQVEHTRNGWIVSSWSPQR